MAINTLRTYPKCPNCGKALTTDEYNHAIEGFRENRLLCIFCEGGERAINFTESNKEFLSKRIRDGNIDEAITISRIAWDNFPILKESADTKKIVETLLRGVQHTINAQILTPINTSISGLNALVLTLGKNPELIQKCSDETMRNINGHLNQIISSQLKRELSELTLQKYAIDRFCSSRSQVIMALMNLRGHGISEDRILYLNYLLEKNGYNVDMKSTVALG